MAIVKFWDGVSNEHLVSQGLSASDAVGTIWEEFMVKEAYREVSIDVLYVCHPKLENDGA